MAKQRISPNHVSRPPMLSEEKIIESDSGEDGSVVEEASEEASDTGSDASFYSIPKRPAPPAKAVPPRKKAKPLAPKTIAPKPIKTPHGFERTTLSASDYAAGSTEFLTEELSRKQVWHITAPASVDIKTIKPFSIADVRSGKPIFSKHGVDYGFLTGLHETERLLLASGEDVEYAQSTAPISGTYHLREMGRSLTKEATDSNKENAGISFAAISTIQPKKPREQPAGLRMRYQPYGSSTTKAQPSSTSPARFRMAPELPESRLDKSEKNKKKKEKKHKTEKKASQQGEDDSQDADAIDVNLAPSSTHQNPSSRMPAESASSMVEKVFEAATETPSKQKKRKKKYRIANEEATV